MDSILMDIVNAIDIWLDELTVQEEKYNRITPVQERIQQTITQIECEGDTSVDISKIKFIGNLWGNMLNLIAIRDSSSKRQLVLQTLKLLEVGEISTDFACEIIMNVFT